MRIASGGLYLRVTEQLADHRQALAKGQSPGREAVAQVVDPDVIQLGPGTDAAPGSLDIREMRSGFLAGDDPGVVLLAGQSGQNADSGIGEWDHAGASFRVAELQLGYLQVDVLPA